MTSILALDVSKTSTGYAFGVPGERPVSGTTTFGGPAHTDDEVWVKAMIWLNEQITVLAPDIIAIEAAWAGNGGHAAATHDLLSGLEKTIRIVTLARTKKAARLVNVQSARKTFVGHGRPKDPKVVVQQKCIALGWLTYETLQNDRADALCVFAHIAAEIDPTFALSLKFAGRRPATRLVPQSEEIF